MASTLGSSRSPSISTSTSTSASSAASGPVSETVPIVPARRKEGPMDPAHAMDWAPLHLGHPRASKTTVHLTDMDAHVFGLEEIAGSELPVAIIILAHGFANKARDMEPMASGLIGEARRLDAEAHGRRRTRDVLVATLRNHGDRRRIRNQRTFENNSFRLIDASMSITGGKYDHQFMMDFLPQVLFPFGERTVVEFMSTGFSMGGHVCWRLLREDPRIRVGVPICSAPSEVVGRLFMARKLPPSAPPTALPPPTADYFLSPSAPGTYSGKAILALQGALDGIMPRDAGTQEWERIAGECAAAAKYIQPDVGHIVSRDMVRMAAEWLWYHGLTEQV